MRSNRSPPVCSAIAIKSIARCNWVVGPLPASGDLLQHSQRNSRAECRRPISKMKCA